MSWKLWEDGHWNVEIWTPDPSSTWSLSYQRRSPRRGRGRSGGESPHLTTSRLSTLHCSDCTTGPDGQLPDRLSSSRALVIHLAALIPCPTPNLPLQHLLLRGVHGCRLPDIARHRPLTRTQTAVCDATPPSRQRRRTGREWRG